jgi:flagellar biosynthesis/type III secretory pathway protein FliH
MLLTEFDEDLFIKTMKEEGREEGLEEGLREGFKKGRNEGFEKGRNEGFKKGRNEGEDRVSRLYQRLIEEKKMTELERAASDRTFREMLYKKYGI